MIGVIDAPIANAPAWTSCPPIRWLAPSPRNGYLADPFGWPGRDNLILCEHYDFATEIGTLRRLTVDGDRIVGERNEPLPLPCHLSFPYLFDHDGAVYLMPESCGARRLALFRWHEETKSWDEVSPAPLEGVAAADSVLFEHDGLFWIAYTDVDLGAADNLNLVYASRLEGPWTPHPANPVRRGAESSRCGGTPFRAEGALYRPAQDCSETYGGGLRLMRVLECSPARYREEEVVRLKPSDRQKPHGLHSLCAWGDRCLVDGKRMEISPRQIMKKAVRRLLRALSKAGVVPHAA